MNWIWSIGAPLVRAILAACFRVRIEGVHHVPRDGSVIIAANHVSVLDGPALSAVTGTHRRRATRNLIAAEVFTGVLGWILRQARQIPIRRGSGDTGALDAALDGVRAGSCVGIFPEGRVGDDPEAGLQRIRSGLTRIALPAQTPVIPAGIWGTQSAWPRSGLDVRATLRRPYLAFVYGEAIRSTPGETPTAFRERYAVALAEQVQRARSLAAAPEIGGPPR
jgi:1-acyl-sn-glycerol-3-phosphate acyltransferase